MQNRTMKEMFNLRLPTGLRDRIKEEAERNRRSMNAEIIFHIERAMFDTFEMKKGEAA
ncbi:Arc family DNA-binding protein [Rhizobium leguminosarum bv. viciae]|uniref:Arc family DNA-binding protein n=1 Tax=Rhizobium leguminosarum TaxID=384 RepID=UPI001441F5DB|nr:Arc family DNA-binding protein [Rhizobium leguminosarum]NKK87563.1 Arc family DNA-binding protein [Rhizobium leguminosarum bv. viciae]